LHLSYIVKKSIMIHKVRNKKSWKRPKLALLSITETHTGNQGLEDGELLNGS
jgi:hypothetical protein